METIITPTRNDGINADYWLSKDTIKEICANHCCHDMANSELYSRIKPAMVNFSCSHCGKHFTGTAGTRRDMHIQQSNFRKDHKYCKGKGDAR